MSLDSRLFIFLIVKLTLTFFLLAFISLAHGTCVCWHAVCRTEGEILCSWLKSNKCNFSFCYYCWCIYCVLHYLFYAIKEQNKSVQRKETLCWRVYWTIEKLYLYVVRVCSLTSICVETFYHKPRGHKFVK